ncbi:hypothetical protein LSH36_153g04016 [Paralvinella palmiformis]|uniref:Uncharacterized protein n=1 Tax=Paralvinella palmiformis TaxID=53620 RepID=A0AAD9JUC2_9ANNE|nr:hypothetical protein LSH36_153g04016 [Paralvinella palmiformis]
MLVAGRKSPRLRPRANLREEGRAATRPRDYVVVLVAGFGEPSGNIVVRMYGFVIQAIISSSLRCRYHVAQHQRHQRQATGQGIDGHRYEIQQMTSAVATTTAVTREVSKHGERCRVNRRRLEQRTKQPLCGREEHGIRCEARPLLMMARIM